MTKEDLKKKFSEIFYNTGYLKYYFSPGRINLIGEHIDYNGGFVFPCAISLGTYAVVSLRRDQKISLYSENFPGDGIISFDLTRQLSKDNVWTDYVKGIISEFFQAGYSLFQGFNAYIVGDLPNGASLSSSASLELLFCEIIRDLNDLEISDLDLVKISQKAENFFVGLKCGIMDQFAIGMSKKNHAILLNCATLNHQYAPLDLKNNIILIMNTNKRRDLVSSKYNERREECEEGLRIIQKKYKDIDYLCELSEEDLPKIKPFIENQTIYKRIIHVVSEMERVKKTYASLMAGNLKSVGELLNASHQSLKENYEVTGRELDLIVHLAQEVKGVLGARMIGAGFAGCAIAIVQKEATEAVISKVKKEYLEEIGYACDIYIAETSNRPQRIA
ncbi:MAG: galactokinase [Anaeroplasmataceae bacterium]|nr:galactokinase [Anaeroplasmataceae bacterium]